MDPLLFPPPPLPPPLLLDLRLPLKPAFPPTGADKLTPFPHQTTTTDKLNPHHAASEKLTGILAPFPTLPHPFNLFQQLRRHHGLMTTERMTPDVILPKTSPVLPITSPLPAVPAPTVLQSFLSSCVGVTSRGGLGEEALAATAGGGPEFLPLMISNTPVPHGMSPYGRKVFPCPQCRYTTDRRNNLKRHMLTMHQLSAKLLECCGVLFRTKAALREHALVFHYHGYSCFYCGRRFCRKALLKRHLSVHNGQKEFLCSVCDYATSHKSNLERHRRVHVRQDGDDSTPHADRAELRHHHRDNGVMSLCDDVKNGVTSLSDDVKSNVSETNSYVDCVSLDELSGCSDEEDEEINVHSD